MGNAGLILFGHSNLQARLGPLFNNLEVLFFKMSLN